jgi:hypothetical protein
MAGYHATEDRMSTALVLDIECRADVEFLTRNDDLLFRDIRAPANYKDEQKIRDYIAAERAKIIEKAALSPLLGRVVAIGMAELNSDFEIEEEPVVIASEDEKSVLTEFCIAAAKHNRIVWAGFNIREFDLPFLAMRLSVHGMRWPGHYPHRNDYLHVVDPRDIYRHNDGGGNLDMHLRAFGLPPKTADGSQVAGMTIDEVARYCADDVIRERLLIRRLAHLFPAVREIQETHP